MTAKRISHLKEPQRLLVPLDLSTLSDQALGLALKLAGPKAKIRLFHASAPVHIISSVGVDGTTVPVYDRALSLQQWEHAKKQLRHKAAAHKRAIEVDVVEAPKAAQAIALAAKRFKADQVVMTTHGRGGLSRLLSGSVAQKLFHLYLGPILLLRPGKKKG